MWLGGKSSTETYLTFQLTVRVGHLWLGAYSEYQQTLFNTISDLREKGMTYQQVSEWLNENGYQTPHGKTFKSNHVFSIHKKGKRRSVRLTKTYEPVLSNFGIRFVDRTLINDE
ncbi:MAG: hypothetical protein DSY87_09155 [Methylococcus sp.]|nr:MAG: hypothetical protein DSY87_09155 [Methylococcus sp.]